MLQPSPLFSSRCVLPMDRELRLFGLTDIDGIITAELTTAQGTVITCGRCAAANGRFLVRMGAVQQPMTGLTLTIQGGGDRFIAEDVATGLVFIAGGQSNMELSLWNADGGHELVHTHSDEDLRWYSVPRVSVMERVAEAEKGCSWQKVMPDTCADMTGIGWFFAEKLRRTLHVPVGIVGCYWGGTSVTAWTDRETLHTFDEGRAYLEKDRAAAGDKDMETWQREQDAHEAAMNAWNTAMERLREEVPGIDFGEIEKRIGKCPWNPPAGPGSPYRPGGLMETMFSRIVPMAATGILFYQGEEDAWRTDKYDLLLETMVRRWRELLLNDELPFLYVQLPMWIDAGAQEDYCWPRLRMSQQKALYAIRNSDMVCMIDCGEYNNIHPTDKKTPGERLADVWLARNGDAEAAKRMPARIISKRQSGDRLVLKADQQLMLKDGEADLFEVCGDDGVWVAAEAAVSGDTVTLGAEACKVPVNARYAYVSYAKVHVFAENGMPLCPFATK